MNQSKDKRCIFLCEDMLKKIATIILKVLNNKQTDFSVYLMTSLARHFSVLIHTLERHTENHVNILGSQKNIFRMFLKI